MEFKLKYIYVFNDINSGNINEIKTFYAKADIRLLDIPMPNFEESQKINSLLGSNVITNDKVRQILVEYSHIPVNIANELCSNMMAEIGMVIPSEQAKKSTIGKLVYWFSTVFNSALNDAETNIYVQTKANKHLIYAVYLLSKLGNNIVLVDENFNEKNYQLYNNFNISYTDKVERLSIKDSSEKAELDIQKVLPLADSGEYNKIAILGEDENNQLMNLLNELNNCGEDTLVFKCGINTPTFDETSDIKVITDKNTIECLYRQLNIAIFADKKYRDEAFRFTKSLVKDEVNFSKALNKVITFVAMYNRYNLSYSRYIFYGKVDNRSLTFLNFLVSIDKHVIMVDTSYESDKMLDTSWIRVKLDKKSDRKYPTSSVNNSIAYNAYREINETLYSGDTLGLYRDRQYKTCSISSLYTTFDELLLLWGEDSTVRPGFSSSNNNVVIPVIYTKILGYSDDALEKLSKLRTQHTRIYFEDSWLIGNQQSMVIHNNVCINETMFNEQKPIYGENGIIEKNLLGYKNFSYKHLDSGVQLHIISKINELIKELNDNGTITQSNRRETIDKILNIGLNLSTDIQQELQWHDFTKQSPKILMICQNRQTLSFEASIILRLLHLCGWDIAFVVPTCYNIIPEYIVEGMQEHLIGEPTFNNPIIDIPFYTEKKKGIFQRLFS